MNLQSDLAENYMRLKQENEKLKADVAMLREALVYHQKLTRPISKSIDALSATASSDAWLKDQKAKVLEDAIARVDDGAKAMLRRKLQELCSPESDIDQSTMQS